MARRMMYRIQYWEKDETKEFNKRYLTGTMRLSVARKLIKKETYKFAIIVPA